MDAGPVVQALSHSKPDGIFNIVLITDYLRFVREGNKRNLFKDRMVVAPFAAYSGYIEPLNKEAPMGWLSAAGYPLHQINTPEHKTFIDGYKKRFGVWPDVSVLVGYNTLKLVVDAVRKAGSDDPQKIADILHSERFDLPDGPLTFRADGISNRGDWFGPTGFIDGKPTMMNAEYIASERYLPTVEENLKSRVK